ncbi:hypothetical protein COO91_09331 (plasmid) [Nostoc flagelliforme CCNUN1]|uniref:Uncharacterized protein n=2 Tax=Nostoc flagelliforme TaxID=1306274 RepID=A0A2K8T6A9_9NOSO|nr:hypothetical protein COO91_09331 [Nostoc flagelliforme CCNUN1]
MRKTIQTLSGAVFVAGKGKECANSECEYFRKHYYASGVLKYSLQRRRLALNEAPRQQKRRLHRNPVSTIQALVNQHTELRTVLEFQALKY